MASYFSKRALVSCFTAVLASAGLIKEDNSTKTLVVLDDWGKIETHSLLFDYIGKKLGHEVQFDMVTELTARLKFPDGKVGHYYDNIVLMAPSSKKDVSNSMYSVDNLVDFLKEEDHNMLIFADTESRRHVRTIANKLGVDFEPNVSTLKEATLCLSQIHNVSLSIYFRVLRSETTHSQTRAQSPQRTYSSPS